MTDRHVSIHVPVLARVEGEGALHLCTAGDRIEELRLRIYEPPRLFEKLLEGRHFEEVPDFTARICGICPVAYQVSAANAFESLYGVELDPMIRALRRILYCGEWLESHALHVHLLAAPDYFGYDSAMAMAADHPEVVSRGLRLHGLGNALMRWLGGRAVHPVGLRVGGFHRAPGATEAAAMGRRLAAGLADAEALVRWVADIAMPADEQDFISVALRAQQGYPLENGRIVSSSGLDISPASYETHFAEHQRPYSTALWSLLDGEPYLTGPLARLNLNLDRLPAATARLVAEVGSPFPSRNMFHSMLARAVEMHAALDEAARLLADYRPPATPAAAVQPCAGTGVGVSEAPRGLLWHRYDADADGLVTAARIVPPTSQNQARLEADLYTSLSRFGLDHDDDALRLHCEKVIRNYDPCISCATHFLRLQRERI